MPLKQKSDGEICFLAPEIDMSSNVVLDAKVSLVTVTKLTGIKVTGGCECSDAVQSNWDNADFSKSVAVEAVEVQRNFIRRDSPASAPIIAKEPVVQAEPIKKVKAEPIQEPVVKETKEEPVLKEESEEEIEIAEPAPVVQSAPPVERVVTPDVSQTISPEVSQAESLSIPPTNPDGTMSDTTLKSEMSQMIEEDANLMRYNPEIFIDGKLSSEWKTKNVFGKYTFMKEDSVGRPIYKRADSTDLDGRNVYLYHIHKSKKWRVGPAYELPEALNCWLFITTKVSDPIDITKDQNRTRRTWHEHHQGKWVPVEQLQISKNPLEK